MISFYKSIGFRLLIISFIVLALPLLVDSFILVLNRYKHNLKDAEATLVRASRLRELPFSEIRPINTPFLNVLAYYLELQTQFPEVPSEALNKKLKKIAEGTQLNEIFLLRKQPGGKYTVVSSGDEKSIGKDYSDLLQLVNLHDAAGLKRGYFSYISEERGKKYFLAMHPILSKDSNELIGVLVVSQEIQKKLQRLLVPDKGNVEIDFALLTPSTIVIAASDPSLLYHYFLPLPDKVRNLFTKITGAKLPEEPLLFKEDLSLITFNWEGEERIGYLDPLSDNQFILLTYASKKKLLISPLKEFFYLYASYIIILLVGGLIAYLCTWRMSRPIQNLSRVMQKIQKGNVGLRYKKDPFGFEINLLGDVFNGMIDNLLAQKKRAEEERVKRETLAKELRLGQQVQRSLLPEKMPAYQGVDIAQAFIPAIEVGGDFYDAFLRQKNHSSELVFAVADVSGKGVQACFYSLSIKNMLRTFANEHQSIAEALDESNRLFMQDTQESGMFVTIIAGTYDNETRILSYFSCGHNPGLIRRVNGGGVEFMGLRDVALGVMPVADPTSHPVQLMVGDVVVFYTDGITEAHNEAFEAFGEERLVACLRDIGESESSVIVDGIIKALEAFVGHAPQHDDITLLVMRVSE